MISKRKCADGNEWDTNLGQSLLSVLICISGRTRGPSRALTLFFVFLTLAGSWASAREIHYGAVTDADVVACDRLHWRGRIEASRTCYTNVLRSSAVLAARAEAAWALNDLQAANSWFQQAMRENPDGVATRVRWGDLYADSHQDAEAMDIYREAHLRLPIEARQRELGLDQ